MLLKIEIGKNTYSADTAVFHNISIPLIFNGEQPNSYNVDKAVSNVYVEGDFVGDTRQGGGCNFEKYELITHCNGTHTECVGHITNERLSIQSHLEDSLVPATLISVSPKNAFDIPDTYNPQLNEDDRVICKSDLEGLLGNVEPEFIQALVVRSLPNDDSKMGRQYMDQLPPFFSLEAMAYLVELGVQHLLVDMPSIDRTFDEGKLNCHHIFWKVDEGSHDLKSESEVKKTITEMIYVKNEVADGKYLLNMQIAPFVADAAPSRPLLFPLELTK